MLIKRALVLSFFILWPCVAHAGPFEDCILQNMKGVSAQAAAIAVHRACLAKTTPMQCRPLLNNPSESDLFAVAQRLNFDVSAARQANYTDQEITKLLKSQCIKECAAASWWSNKFGECRLD